MMKLVIYYL